MKKICVMMIAACVLAVSTANTADASLITKRIDGVKKIANLVSNTVSKTADNVGKTVWNNKGAIAVGTVATIALTNPDAAVAAVNGTADIVTGVVTGTTEAVTQSVTQGVTNGVQKTTGGTFSTVLFYLVIIGLVLIVMKFLLRGAVRKVLPLLVIGILLCFVVTAEASILSAIPEMQCAVPVLVKPVAHFIMLVITVASIFL